MFLMALLSTVLTLVHSVVCVSGSIASTALQEQLDCLWLPPHTSCHYEYSWHIHCGLVWELLCRIVESWGMCFLSWLSPAALLSSIAVQSIFQHHHLSSPISCRPPLILNSRHLMYSLMHWKWMFLETNPLVLQIRTLRSREGTLMTKVHTA